MPRILIVDDDFIERKGILMLSSRLFPNTEGAVDPLVYMEAENGRKALALALSEPPDILLTDIRMPLMDGITLLYNLREALPDLVSIILTAYGEFEYAQAAIECHVSHYLLKPVSPDAFKKVMEEALSKTAELSRVSAENPIRSDEPLNRTGSGDRIIGEVLAIIHKEYMTDLSVENIAERVYLSPSYLSYLFKKHTNNTIVRYLTDIRMRKARESLMETNMRIVDVAAAVGYHDVPYFCTLFKNKYGMTPSQFRNGSGSEV